LNRDNRHQYFETAMLSVSEAEQQMLEAEARGRERRLREIVLKRRLQTLGSVLLVVAVIAAAVGLAIWVGAR
jgi:predicted PurR-regulated permease PerM